MKMRSSFLAFTFLFANCIFAQIENKNLFPSPNAAGLGLYGQIPVDLFTGLPQIDVPLYDFKSRDLSVPIHLSYHAAGIKPSDHASWVGLGWNLQAGGVITRVLNDLPDEYVDYQAAPAARRGFFYNYSYLSASNWADASTALANDEKMIYPDFYCALCTGPTLYNDQTRIDLSPDEFQFNFLGMGGSLIMGQDGQWKLKSKDGLNFTVTTEVGPYSVLEPTSLYSSVIKNCLIKFTLVDAFGTQYTFGGTDAVEFARKGTGGGQSTQRDGGTIPTSWYLTKIKSLTGDVIDFTYTRDGYQIMVNSSNSGYLHACSICQMAYMGGGLIDDEVSIVDGITLSSITGANGTVIFDKTKANILDYTFQSFCAVGEGGAAFCDWVKQMQPAYSQEVFSSGNTGPSNGPSSTFMKLNSITVKDVSNTALKKISLSYYENPANRLFLTSLIESGSDNQAVQPYKFTYNNKEGLANVPYSTLNVDHWGYYNGVDPRTGLVFPGVPTSVNAYNNAFKNTYTTNRSPVTNLMQYAVLTQIDYPTGGNTQFKWEPHQYSKCINQDPVNNKVSITVQDLGTSVVGGGLRIKQIVSQANFNSPVLTKNYFYYRDYLNNNYLSSGLLNSAPPLYVTEYSQAGTYIYKKWTSNNILPLQYTNGAPYTYTNVVEVNTDGSYKTFTYTNQDNGYLNTLPKGSYITGVSINNLKEFNTNSLELERGLLLNESTYGSGSILLNKKVYQYNDDPYRFSNAIRSVYSTRNFALNSVVLSYDGNGFLNVSANGPVVYKNDNLFALNTYIHYPYLQSLTETQYDQNGLNPLTTTTNYTYDNYRNKKTIVATTSKGEQLATTYKYAGDVLTSTPAIPVNEQSDMLAAHLVGQVLEKTVTRNTVEVEHTRTDYQKYVTDNTSFIIPTQSFSAVNGNTLESVASYTGYDNKGNILSYMPRTKLPTSFKWDYKQACPTVKITNATYTSVQSLASLGFGGTFTTKAGYTFTTDVSGTIAFSIYPTNSLSSGVTYNYSIAGASNKSGSFCLGSTGSCRGYASLSFTGMPAGTYYVNFTATNSVAGDYPQVVCSGSYSKFQSVLTPEFYYEGFEQKDQGNNVLYGIGAHTGNGYYDGSAGGYYVSFNPPATHTSYLIQWWKWIGGKWNFNTQPYTGPTSLPGIVDDVRVLPTDAQINTYTYNPLIGQTSEINTQGITKTYEYDGLGRLSVVRDNDRNVIAKYCYNYAGATTDCKTPALVGNAPKTATFTKQDCLPNYTANGTVTYAVPINKYYAPTQVEADQLAQNDINVNGQGYANTNGVCQRVWYNQAQPGPFTKTNCTSGTGSTVSYTVPANTYSSLIDQADADNKAKAAGQAYANANGTCGSTCAFSATSAFGIATSGISASGSTVNFYIVFYAKGTTTWTNDNGIANITGSCAPSATRILTMSESGRTWSVTISSAGLVSVKLMSGTAPATGASISLMGGSYSL